MSATEQRTVAYRSLIHSGGRVLPRVRTIVHTTPTSTTPTASLLSRGRIASATSEEARASRASSGTVRRNAHMPRSSLTARHHRCLQKRHWASSLLTVVGTERILQTSA